MPKGQVYKTKNSSNPDAGKKRAKVLPLHTKIATGEVKRPTNENIKKVGN